MSAKSKVYFSQAVDPQMMVKMYDTLGVKLAGKTAVKLHSGEAGNKNFIGPAFMKPVIDHVQGTIVESNTAYPGKRNTTENHWETIKQHGWTDIADVDILDEERDLELEIPDGQRIKKNFVGGHMPNYDSMLVLSHFKGHAMGGYGGALKNTSIGIASSHGKSYIHGAGEPDKMWSADQDAFLESMADAAKSIVDFFKDQIVFINVMANLSVDCDCDANAAAPEMADIGILASLDPVALDQACLDLVYASKDPGKDGLIERIVSKNGIHTIEAAAAIGVGQRDYELVEIE